jgi:hypothetical protein
MSTNLIKKSAVVLSIFFTAIFMLSCNVLGGGDAGDENALYPLRSDGSYGYVDRDGNTVIEPQFDLADLFSEDRAAVMPDIDTAKWGFIDTNGELVIEAQFDQTLQFSEGLAAVRIGDQWGFVDKNGNMVLQPQYYSGLDPQVITFSEGKAVVGVEPFGSTAPIAREVGYIDTEGNFVIEPNLSFAGQFVDGLAPAANASTRQRGFIDETGEFVILLPDDVSATGPFSEEVAPGIDFKQQVSTGTCSYGFLNKEGEWVIEPQFCDLRPFKGGYASYAVDDETLGLRLWGFIDKSGEVVIDAQYLFVSDFYHGLARVFPPSGKGGFIDESGQLVLENE